jgi:hypothetical protein
MRGGVPDDIIWSRAFDAGDSLIEEATGLAGPVVTTTIVVVVIVGVRDGSVGVGGMDGSFDRPGTVIVVDLMVA